MHALTNSGAILLAVLLFFLLILLAELSYIFCRRIRFLPDPASKEVVLQFFMCCKKENHHSRVEPTGIVSVQIEDEDVAAATTAAEDEDAVVDKWQVSRLLFTIEEEDLELMEADDDDDGEKDNKVEVRVEIPVEYSGDPTPFLTPCDSPPYFTPSPSPSRDMDDDVINDVYDVSRGCCINFQDSDMC